MQPARFKAVALGLLLAATSAGPVLAHHSYAMFDVAKNVTVEGTVREFQWTQPHAWIQLLAADPATGKEVEWSIELASPSLMARKGWTRNSLKAGDKVSTVIHPLKNGQIGGSMVSATRDGQPVGSLKGPEF